MTRLLWLGGVCMVLVVLLGSPLVLKQSDREGDRSEAISNAKQIGLALAEFDDEYGCLPNDLTAAKVKAATGTPLKLDGASSNSLFRQLLVTGLKSEKPFYARIAGSRRSDDLFGDDAHAIAAGECGFAYVAELAFDRSDPATPVAMSALIPGTSRFDRSIFGGKAIVLFLDNSAKALPIDSSGRVQINGMDLFDPRQPFWHGKAPDLRWPE